MATRGAESLGNKVEAGVVLLERGSHAHSCKVVVSHVFAGKFRVKAAHIPTLTAVLLSSSEARLPPILLLMLNLLELRFGLIMALIGLLPRAEAGGEVGGDSIVAATASAVCREKLRCRCVS